MPSEELIEHCHGKTNDPVLVNDFAAASGDYFVSNRKGKALGLLRKLSSSASILMTATSESNSQIFASKPIPWVNLCPSIHLELLVQLI